MVCRGAGNLYERYLNISFLVGDNGEKRKTAMFQCLTSKEC